MIIVLHVIGAGGVVGFLEVFSSTEETRESHAADAMVGNLPTREYLPHCHSIRPLCSELGLKTSDYIRQVTTVPTYDDSCTLDVSLLLLHLRMCMLTSYILSKTS